MLCFLFFFFKQKTAYERRISDWSSDVCSSDLIGGRGAVRHPPHHGGGASAYRVRTGSLLLAPGASSGRRRLWLAQVRRPRRAHRPCPDVGGRADRKSTRLNSSQ